MNSMEDSGVGKDTYLVRTKVLHGEDIDDLKLVTGYKGINPPQGRLEVPK